MPEMVLVKCARCKQPFYARVADRKRGWGRCCSKSCKAIRQVRTHGHNYVTGHTPWGGRDEEYDWGDNSDEAGNG